MKSDNAIRNGTSIFVGIIVAIAAFVRPMAWQRWSVVVAVACGRVFSLQGVEQQIHGATAQGAGLTLFEDLALDQGRMRARALSEYLIPTALDLPDIECLALDDHVCLVMARDHGWCCLTNDRALRNACGREGVPVLWGLEAMLGLVEAGLLLPENAIEVATLIHSGNPAFVASALLAEFERKVLRLAQGAPLHSE